MFRSLTTWSVQLIQYTSTGLGQRCAVVPFRMSKNQCRHTQKNEHTSSVEQARNISHDRNHKTNSTREPHEVRNDRHLSSFPTHESISRTHFLVRFVLLSPFRTRLKFSASSDLHCPEISIKCCIHRFIYVNGSTRLKGGTNAAYSEGIPVRRGSDGERSVRPFDPGKHQQRITPFERGFNVFELFSTCNTSGGFQ